MRLFRNAWFALVVLTLINLLNYLDRFVLPAVEESIKHSALRPTDTQFGFLASAFIIVYIIASPFFGSLGDRAARPRLLALGVTIWSLATAAGGLAAHYGQLLAARASVGVGEAAYGTIAPALLADLFPTRLRGRVFAIFFMATPVGSALGYVLGGAADARFGWRAAFFIAGLPGLALALFALFLPDPPRGGMDDPAVTPHEPSAGAPIDAVRAAGRHEPDSGAAEVAREPVRAGILRTYLTLLRLAPYRRTVLGFAAYTFALGGIAVWMPAFLVRERGLTAQQATVQLGAVLVLTGFTGTFIGGVLGDWLLRRTRQAYLWVSGIATLAAAPLAWVALTTTDRTLFWATLASAEVLIFVCTGPVNSAVVNAVPATMRAAAMALCILAIHILGDVPSPWMIGRISDRSSLGDAMQIIPVAIVIAGLVWVWGALAGGRGEEGDAPGREAGVAAVKAAA